MSRKNSNTYLSSLLLTSCLAFSFGNAYAYEQGDWLIHGRIINVNPDSDSSTISLPSGSVPDSGVTVDDAWTIDISFTRMFTKNIAVNLLLDLSSQHDVIATGATLGGLGKIVDARVLPPALLVQYHFNPDAKAQPYVGAGINFTLFFDESATASLEGALGPSDVDLDESFGVALQAGVDIDMRNGWFWNVDVKYIDLDTTATITSPGGISTVDVDINPFVLGIGFGKRF